ncbi:NAD(+) synthase [Patescibacteria group bacterium]|nr:NAD(+) synthase [Patescibacteria group bacterium]
MQNINTNLIKKLHAYAKKFQYQRAVLGLSGGLDSAVAYLIAIRAFGPKNVTALILPEIGLTPEEDIDQARLLAKHFESEVHYQPINNFLVDYNFVPWTKSEEANENLKAQTRATLISQYANSFSALFIGTPNKSDLLLGAGSLSGEFAGEIHLLGSLFKTELIELAKHLELPEELIEKESSRHLKPHQTDFQDFGLTWPKIDEILKELASGTDPETLIQKGMDPLAVHRITRIIQQNERHLLPTPAVGVADMEELIKKAQSLEASS